MEFVVEPTLEEDARWIQREAVANARHRAQLAGFRPGKLVGVHPSELRAAALRPSLMPTTNELLVLGAITAIAFFVGRWWGRRPKKNKPATAVGGALLRDYPGQKLADYLTRSGPVCCADEDGLDSLGAE